MKFRKVLTLVLAAVMVMSLAVPAFADVALTPSSAAKETTSMKVNSTTNAPALRLVTPASVDVVLNPYGLTVKTGDSTTSTDQVVSAAQYIANISDAAVEVKVSASATVAGNAVLATTPISKKSATTNSVFMLLETAMAAYDKTQADFAAAVTEPTWKTVAVDGSGTTGLKDFTTVNNYQVVLDKTAKSPKNTIVLAAAADADTTGANPDKATAPHATQGVYAFHLIGDAVKEPTVSWAKTDKVTPVITFTFTLTGKGATNPATMYDP